MSECNCTVHTNNPACRCPDPAPEFDLRPEHTKPSALVAELADGIALRVQRGTYDPTAEVVMASVLHVDVGHGVAMSVQATTICGPGMDRDQCCRDVVLAVRTAVGLA